ncbi:Protein of unknown function [Pseudarcicella hirudinis]|uniref:DUF3089 domain-containing protein n=1 Tax=Pseudarcicella hirudinis TaxID=1079859 RepID=A0A1I5VYC0_9BACT|nr:DUF3089 domain-containing protein [Pseudarcicella hirudinis]SFQ12006.1 Protein of unknown function [Pseudarcicella hirudinis]
MKNLIILLITISLVSCKKNLTIIKEDFNHTSVPPRPDYSREENWASLPSKVDPADSIPVNSNLKNEQATALADVFFVHPTIFTGEPKDQYIWNADVNNAEMNQNVDYSTILNQASVFNGSCKIYAPRYRQAHYFAFFTKNHQDRDNALNLAYEDVKSAFEYYLRNYNHGRPVIIASHSQGTVHATRLIKEFFDEKPLQTQLVAAYLIGISTSYNSFTNIKPCKSAKEVGCFVSWNTFTRDYYPSWYENGLRSSVSTNPLTWSLDENYAPKELNKGGVGLRFRMIPELTDAQNHQGMLWISQPYIKGRFLLKTKVWHKADINFFYMSIRENAALRIDNFLKEAH